MSGITLDELCMRVGVTLTQLDETCTSEHIRDISLFLESWRHVAPHLGLSNPEIEAANFNANSEEERRLKILESWKARFAFKATYRVLIEAFLKIGRADQAKNVCHVLVPQQPIEDYPTCPPETTAITPPPRIPSTLDAFSTHSEDVSLPVPGGSVQVEHDTVESSSALPTHQLVQTSGKEVGVVQQEKDMLVSMYDDLVENAVETFSKQQENSPEFFRKLRIRVAVLPTSLKYQHQNFLDNHSSQIAKATTVEEIFAILNKYCNFFNCSLLAHIIIKFGDKSLNKQLTNYTTVLKEFCLRTKITDFIKAYGETNVPPGFVTVKMKMGEEWERSTLEDVEEYRKSLALDAALADHANYANGGVSGSIYLLWSVPDHAVRFLVVTMDQQFCNQHSIEEVTIDGKRLEDYEHQYNLQEFKPIQPLQHTDEFSEGLVWASGEGCLEDVIFLLSIGVKVNSRSQNGLTALIIAVQSGHSKTVRVLVEAGADVNLQVKCGKTALMWASGSGHTDIAGVLLSAGAQVDLQDENGLTALIIAVQSGHSKTVRVLVEAGADVNLQVKTSGRSALFYGAEKGDLEIVKLLIQAGANLSLRDEDGVTAVEVAEVHGHQAVCDELRKHERVSRRPLSQAVRDRVLATGQLLRALYKRLEKRILRTQKKELARTIQDFDQDSPPQHDPGFQSRDSPPQHSGKGVRDPHEEYRQQEYTDMPRPPH